MKINNNELQLALKIISKLKDNKSKNQFSETFESVKVNSFNELYTTITKTNMQEKINYFVYNSNYTPESFIIPANTIKSLKTIQESEVCITDNQIISGTKTINYTQILSKNYPTINTNNFYFEIPENELLKMLEVNYCVDGNHKNPIFNGVCFENNNVYGCNGFRISVREGSFENNTNFIITKDFAILLQKVCNKKSTSLVRVYGELTNASENKNKNQKIKFIFENFEVIGDNIPEQYLNVKNLISKEQKYNITVNVNDILNNVKSIKNGVLQMNTIDNYKLSLSIYNTLILNNDNLVSKDLIPCDYNLNDFKIACNISYINELLSFYKNKQITIENNGKIDPIVIKDVHEKQNNYEMMLPIRINHMEED